MKAFSSFLKSAQPTVRFKLTNLQVARAMYHFHEECQTVVRATVRTVYCVCRLFSLEQCIIQQLFDSVFLISGIVKVSVSVISLGIRLD